MQFSVAGATERLLPGAALLKAIKCRGHQHHRHTHTLQAIAPHRCVIVTPNCPPARPRPAPAPPARTRTPVRVRSRPSHSVGELPEPQRGPHEAHEHPDEGEHARAVPRALVEPPQQALFSHVRAAPAAASGGRGAPGRCVEVGGWRVRQPRRLRARARARAGRWLAARAGRGVFLLRRSTLHAAACTSSRRGAAGGTLAGSARGLACAARPLHSTAQRGASPRAPPHL